MTSLITIQREVEKIKQAIIPDKQRTILITFRWPAGGKDQPHGKYGFTRYNMTRQEYEAVSEDEEISRLCEIYSKEIPDHLKKKWSTFEEYLKTRECHCGNYGHVKVKL